MMSIAATIRSPESATRGFANRLVALLLRSPLHGLIGKRTMLVTVIGRKSGQSYTLPVNYARLDDTILVVSRRNSRWWKNLRGGSRVVVHLDEADLPGFATVVENDSEAIAGGYEIFRYQAYRQTMSADKAREKTRGRVLIRITLAR